MTPKAIDTIYLALKEAYRQGAIIGHDRDHASVEMHNLLRRDWAIRVLNTFAKSEAGVGHRTYDNGRGVSPCELLLPNGKTVEHGCLSSGEADVAQMLAARDAFKRLSPAEQADVGDCP